MAQTRDTQIIQTPEVVIDPRYAFVPDNIVGARPATQAEIDSSADDGVDDDSILDEGSVDDYDLEPDNGVNILGAPQYIYVDTQTIRTAADGTTVVDVILGVEDVPGATNYEIRITAQ